MNIKVELRHKKAIMPTKAHSADAGFDLTAVSIAFNGAFLEYDTGIAVEVPEGYVGLVYPRSSVSKKDLSLANSVGVIDSGYTGTIKLRFRETTVNGEFYKPGDRVGQLVFMKLPEVDLVAGKLGETARGAGGFGSSGA